MKRLFPRRLLGLATAGFLSAAVTGCSGADCSGVQRATMIVTVLDAATGDVICGATLKIVGSSDEQEVVTCSGLGVDGRYPVYAPKDPIYRLEASASGYQSSTKTVPIEYDEDCGDPRTVTVEIKLQLVSP